MNKKMDMKDIEERFLKDYTGESRVLKKIGKDNALKLYERLLNSQKAVEIKGYNEPVLLYFSAEECNCNWGTKFNIEAYNAMGRRLGKVNYYVDSIIKIDTLEVETDVENRDTIGEVLLNEIEEIAKEAKRPSITGIYYPEEKEFKYEDFYKKHGYDLERDGDRFYEFGKFLKKTNVKDDDGAELE